MRDAVLVRLIAATLAIAAVVAGVAYLARFTDNDHSTAAVNNELFAADPDATPLRFLVTATSLDPAERTLSATVSFVPSIGEPVLVAREQQPIVDPTTGALRPEFADLNLTITVGDLWSGDVTVPYPLAKVVGDLNPTGIPRVDVVIPADVDPADFPNDTYTVDLRLSVTLPPGVSFARDTPVLFGVAADDRLGQWHLDTDRVVADSETMDRDLITVVFSRGWAYWAFVYAVSLMPAVIGLGFVARNRRRGRANPGDTASALELAAALLALIALRQVFVPTDISGLTRLDVLLGVQLLLLCWLMAVTYTRDPEPAPNPEPAPPAELSATPPAGPPPVRPAEHSVVTGVVLVALAWLGFLLGRRRTRKR